ncbi:DNA polymerase alpha subunit B [Candida viswanathii]|uniref:DNA polymerase alpha subunit B n=1 Tax=Candida viswanathii TaxID=5486 RepID=A0A367XRJ0_9ASCO|nr:DNA polymerase alpha subunit B [Candida viswanathii]
MPVADDFKKEVAAAFGPSVSLSDEEYNKLQWLAQTYEKSMEDLFLEWESFNVAEVQQDLDLNIDTLNQLQAYLQIKLSRNQTPGLKKIKDGSAGSGKKLKRNNDLSSGGHIPSTPYFKKRRYEDDLGNGGNATTPDFKTPMGHGTASSPVGTDYETANNTFAGNTTTTTSNSLLETLNPDIEEIQNDELPEEKPFRLATNFDASKFKFRTMQMKLLESADVLDDQIDRMIEKYQEQNKTADLQFGNPCLSTQSDILCCGRIVPDSPLYDKEFLNSTSLYLETSRMSGIGQRVPLNIDNLPSYSFFPGQIVVFKGKNPSGRSFIVEENMALPQLGAPVTSADELKEFGELQRNTQGLKLVVASGPFSNLNRLNFDKLERLIDQINTKILPNVVILNGPFLDLTNKVVESGDFEFDRAQEQPKNLDDVFKLLITPVLKKIDPRIQVILYPNLKDSCVKHCSYPQDAFDRKKFGLPKNFRVFPNPSSFQINEILIGNSNLDIFKDLRDVFKEDATVLSNNNRFERIINHVLEQRRYYPAFPGSIGHQPKLSTAELLNGAEGEHLDGLAVGGSSLEMPYLGVTELGDSLPDVLILPSEFKYFAKVVQGVMVINPGFFIKPSKEVHREDGSYAVINVKPPNLEDDENNVDAIDDSNALFYHNVYKRSRVDIYSS